MGQELEQHVSGEQEAIEGSISGNGCGKVWLHCSCETVFCLSNNNFQRVHNPEYVLYGKVTCPYCEMNYELRLEAK